MLPSGVATLKPNALSVGQCRPVVSVSKAMYGASENLTAHSHYFPSLDALDAADVGPRWEPTLEIFDCGIDCGRVKICCWAAIYSALTEELVLAVADLVNHVVLLPQEVRGIRPPLP